MLSVLLWVSAASFSKLSRSRISGSATAQPSLMPGAKDLGEAAQVQHPAFGVQALQGGQVVTRVAQRPVGSVLDNQHVMLVRQFDQSVPPRQAQRCPGGVGEVRYDIDHLRRRLGRQDPSQVVGVHAVIVAEHRGVRRLARIERDQRSRGTWDSP